MVVLWEDGSHDEIERPGGDWGEVWLMNRF